ncbi:MAG: peroxidase-related enzyme [Pseudolabrys sp.]|nr:peroxidase-related enzyme [Pseudolabrys sp.]MCW5686148.1 peroxidase-related enzyme [Pseudolabrys sp.]
MATAKTAAAQRAPGKRLPSKTTPPPAQAKSKAKTGAVAKLQIDDAPAIALDLPRGTLSPAMLAYFRKCEEKLGFIPNVLLAYAFDNAKLEAFVAMYNDLMLGPSGLSKLEREMIAVAVSSQNRCYYCLTAHGAAVRQYAGNPILGEQMVMNYRAARLDKRQRAMLDFAVRLTMQPWAIEEPDRERLRRAGFNDRDIWDISAVVGFFNMSNRVASATDMRPNTVYHQQAR